MPPLFSSSTPEAGTARLTHRDHGSDWSEPPATPHGLRTATRAAGSLAHGLKRQKRHRRHPIPERQIPDPHRYGEGRSARPASTVPQARPEAVTQSSPAERRDQSVHVRSQGAEEAAAQRSGSVWVIVTACEALGKASQARQQAATQMDPPVLRQRAHIRSLKGIVIQDLDGVRDASNVRASQGTGWSARCGEGALP